MCVSMQKMEGRAMELREPLKYIFEYLTIFFKYSLNLLNEICSFVSPLLQSFNFVTYDEKSAEQ